MASNPARSYGTDIACISDADELFTEAVGVDVIMQDTIHVLTCDEFLGPGGAGRGKDLRTLIGKSTADLAEEQPNILEVIERDDRITKAEVELTATTTNGMADVILRCVCQTELGPFDFTRSVLDLTEGTFGDIES